MLPKAKYKATTGREQKQDEDVLFYQIRQSFVVGEITPEEANRVGCELARRWTKGHHAFFVTTHIDRPHIHSHIYINSTSLDCTGKFRGLRGTAKAVRRLSDRICLEDGLFIVERPHLPRRGQFKHYGEWQQAKGQWLPTFQERLRWQIDTWLSTRPSNFGAFLRGMQAPGFEVKRGRCSTVSFRTPSWGQGRFTRLRVDTLGVGYGSEDIHAIIAGRAPLPKERRAPKSFSLVVDIQTKMRQGKGPAYEQWAKIYNLKQMAATLQYLQENDLADYAKLAQRATVAADRFHTLEWQIKGVEGDLKTNAELRAAVVDYAKPRSVFDGYKTARYSRKYLVARCQGRRAMIEYP